MLEMKWYEQLFRFLFPLRFHLIDEVEYLKSQLATQTRRNDVLLEQLLNYKAKEIMEKKPLPRPIKAPIDPADLQGMGFKAYEDRKRAIILRREQENATKAV
jgi:hypothetical protein